jgi:hypothetical protein
MGFMTGSQYQCQECEEIIPIPIEFDNTEGYVEFLKVQSPEKFAQIEDDLKSVEKETEAPISMPKNEIIELSPNNGKLSHICIFEGCQKGKSGGRDYCRKHWLEGHDLEF